MLCVCVCGHLLTMEMEVSLFICVRVRPCGLPGGKDGLCFWAWGRPRWLREYPGAAVAFQWKGAVSL